MNQPHSLPIKEGIERILHSYRSHCSDKVPFRVTEGSSELDALVVFWALLQHAIDSSSVACEIWEVFKPSLENDIGLLSNLQPVLFPCKGDWDAVDDTLVKMGPEDAEELLERIKTHACGWITGFLLPSMLFLPPF